FGLFTPQPAIAGQTAKDARGRKVRPPHQRCQAVAAATQHETQLSVTAACSELLVAEQTEAAGQGPPGLTPSDCNTLSRAALRARARRAGSGSRTARPRAARAR